MFDIKIGDRVTYTKSWAIARSKPVTPDGSDLDFSQNRRGTVTSYSNRTQLATVKWDDGDKLPCGMKFLTVVRRNNSLF